MPARDYFHQVVRSALVKNGWTITHDPYTLEMDEGENLYVDLGAEQLLGAERGVEKIAVEIKSFSSLSPFTDFHHALGQYLSYKWLLEEREPDRKLYMAVPAEKQKWFEQKMLPRKASLITIEPDFLRRRNRGNNNMEKLEHYKNAVQNILADYAQYMATSDDFQLETIFDTERNHYQLMVIGWRGHERIYSSLLHLDIIDGKIWVQQNNTQFTLIDDFDRLGIDRQDIVNGLIPAYRRQIVAIA